MTELSTPLVDACCQAGPAGALSGMPGTSLLQEGAKITLSWTHFSNTTMTRHRRSLPDWSAIPPVQYTPRPASHPQSPAESRARSRWQQQPGHDVVRCPQGGQCPSRSEAQPLHCKAMESLQACSSTFRCPADMLRNPLNQATRCWLLEQACSSPCTSGGDLSKRSVPRCTPVGRLQCHQWHGLACTSAASKQHWGPCQA